MTTDERVERAARRIHELRPGDPEDCYEFYPDWDHALRVAEGTDKWTYAHGVMEQARAALAAADTSGDGLDVDRVLRKFGSLQGQIREMKSNVNALQVETERLEDYVRSTVAAANSDRAEEGVGKPHESSEL